VTWRKRMKYLRDLGMIATKAGPTGDFHYVLLLNPNTGLEAMWTRGMVQDVVYSRFLDRITEVGAYGELEAIRAYWAAQRAQAEAAATAQTAADTPPAAAGAGAEAP